jgi:hypothetical protein
MVFNGGFDEDANTLLASPTCEADPGMLAAVGTVSSASVTEAAYRCAEGQRGPPAATSMSLSIFTQ